MTPKTNSQPSHNVTIDADARLSHRIKPTAICPRCCNVARCIYAGDRGRPFAGRYRRLCPDCFSAIAYHVNRYQRMRRHAA